MNSLAGVRYSDVHEIRRERGERLLAGFDPARERHVRIRVFETPDVFAANAVEAQCSFLREITHPSLTEIIEVGREADGAVFCVYPELEGTSLNALPQRETQQISLLLPIVAQLLAALEQLHRRAWAHAWLSPDKISIIQKPELKATLSGAGLLWPAVSQAINDMSGDEAQYMAPERIRGCPADVRSDLYELGLVLYEAVTGRKAFEGSGLELVRAQLYQEPRPLQELAPRFPDVVARWIQTLITKDRSLRFYSAHEALLYFVNHSLLPPDCLTGMPERSPTPMRAVKPIGREPAQSALQRFFHDQPERTVFEFSGEIGIGKSAMLRNAAAELQALGWRIHWLENDLSDLDAVVAPSAGDTDDNGVQSATGLAKAIEEAHKEQRRCVIIIDDSEDLDSARKQVLQEYISQSFDTAVMTRILAAHRSQLPLFGSRANVLALPRLGLAHIPLFFRETLGSVEFSQEFYEAAYRSTGGNPLYLELLVDRLYEEGHIVRRDGIWWNVADDVTPFTLSQLVFEALNALSPSETHLLGLLFVGGRRLPLNAFLLVCELTPTECLACLARLQARGFITVRNMMVGFSHAAMLEAARAWTGPDRVAAMRQRFADIFSAHPGALPVAATAWSLLDKARQREIADKLIAEMQRAAEAGDEARTQSLAAVLCRASELSGSVEVAMEAYRIMSAAFSGDEWNAEKREFLARVCLIAHTAGAIEIEADLTLQLAQLSFTAKSYLQAIELADRSRLIGADLDGWGANAARALYLKAQCLYRRKQWDEVIDLAEDCIRALLERNLASQAAEFCIDVGYAYAKIYKKYDLALEYYDRAAELYSKSDNEQGYARMLGNKGVAYQEMQNYEQALICFEQAGERYLSLGDQRGALTAFERQIQVRLAQGEYAGAKNLAERALHSIELAQRDGYAERFAALLARIEESEATATEATSGASPVAVEDTEAELRRTERLLPPLTGDSPAVTKLVDFVRQAAAVRSPVLITGALGVGKEGLARAIHRESPANGDFIVMRVAGYSEEELLSRMFGDFSQRSGANASGFAGVMQKLTVYIEDIVESSTRFQSRLAEYLREYAPWEPAESTWLQTRIIAGTGAAPDRQNALLPELRPLLSVLHIEVPTLRHRKQDIPELVELYIEKYNRLLDKRVRHCDTRLLRKLMRKGEWSANLLELEALIQRLMIREETEALTGDIELVFQDPAAAPKTETDIVSDTSSSLVVRTIEDLQKEHILRVLDETNGNKSAAAKALDIKRTTLIARMKKFGIMP